MSYQKQCGKCGKTIFVNETNKIWHAFEDSTLSQYHRCKEVQPPSSVIERVSSLEKFVRQLEKKLYLQQEQIDELRKERI